MFSLSSRCHGFKSTTGRVYPKLKESEGFEILRRGAQTSDLVLIQPPRSGYSVPFLRDSSELRQAIAFIRPIQNNLDMTPTAVVDSFEVNFQDIADMHKYIASMWDGIAYVIDSDKLF